jgi:hypothetical protein
MNEELDLIEKAHKAADRLERANKITEELQKKQEAMDARRILGGQAEAGDKVPELSQEEKDKIAMKKYFKGTAIESALK